MRVTYEHNRLCFFLSKIVSFSGNLCTSDENAELIATPEFIDSAIETLSIRKRSFNSILIKFVMIKWLQLICSHNVTLLLDFCLKVKRFDFNSSIIIICYNFYFWLQDYFSRSPTVQCGCVISYTCFWALILFFSLH